MGEDEYDIVNTDAKKKRLTMADQSKGASVIPCQKCGRYHDKHENCM
jgi:ribosomal protein L32